MDGSEYPTNVVRDSNEIGRGLSGSVRWTRVEERQERLKIGKKGLRARGRVQENRIGLKSAAKG